MWRNVRQAPQQGHPYTDSLLQMIGMQHTGITIPYSGAPVLAQPAAGGGAVGDASASASAGGDGPLYAVAGHGQVVGGGGCPCENEEEIDID
jgi:hypothetical protein